MFVKHTYFDRFNTLYWNDAWTEKLDKRPVSNAGAISFKRDSTYPTYVSQYTTNLTFGYCDNVSTCLELLPRERVALTTSNQTQTGRSADEDNICMLKIRSEASFYNNAQLSIPQQTTSTKHLIDEGLFTDLPPFNLQSSVSHNCTVRLCWMG